MSIFPAHINSVKKIRSIIGGLGVPPPAIAVRPTEIPSAAPAAPSTQDATPEVHVAEAPKTGRTFLEGREWAGFRFAIGDANNDGEIDAGVRVDVHNPFTGKTIELVDFVRNAPVEQVASLALKAVASLGIPYAYGLAASALGMVKEFAPIRKLLGIKG